MLSSRLLVNCIKKQNVRYLGNYKWYQEKLGNREVVGFGYSGDEVYIDRHDCPMPAIRFREVTPDIKLLREKEKGDWKKLTLEEKKALYRASFCQTFAEMNAPTGEWKNSIGWSLFFMTCALWAYAALKKFIYPPLPDSFSEEARQAQYERMLAMNVNPITGISSHKFKD